MSQPIVSKSDTFGDWLEKTNDISRNVGDPADLTTLVKDDLVRAINSISSDPKDRGGLAKDAQGKLFADVDDNSINVSNNNKLQIKNDGVQAKHLNKDVAGDGLRQLQDESLAIAPDMESISTEGGKVTVKRGGVTMVKLALNDPGTVITWGTDRVAMALPPGAAGAALVSQGEGLPAAWGAGGGAGTILAHSGYLTVGGWGTGKTERRNVDTLEITLQCGQNLTNLVNIQPTPGGPKATGSFTSGDSPSMFNSMTVTTADPDYGFIWSSDQGIISLRMFTYFQSQMQIYHTGDDGYSISESVHYGMKLFNVNDVTFISFKLKEVNFRTVQSISTYFLIAELLAKTTVADQTYYASDGVTAIADWAGGIAYTSGVVVKSNDKLYKMITTGTATSSLSAGAPLHTYFGTGVDQGTAEKAYGSIVWRFLGEV